MDCMNYQITCERGFNDMKVYINGILHIHIETDKYLGLQSYYEGTRKQKMIIEISMVGGMIKTQYHREDIFKEVLKVIDENI